MMDKRHIKTFVQLAKYAVLGVTSNAIMFSLYLTITHFGVGHKETATLTYVLGVALSFLLNRKITFNHQGGLGPVMVKYCTAYGIGYVINMIALYVLVDCLHFMHQWVQAGMVFVLAAILFLLQKFWVFKKRNLPIRKDNFISLN